MAAEKCIHLEAQLLYRSFELNYFSIYINGEPQYLKRTSCTLISQ